MRYYLSIPVPTDLSDCVSAFEKKWQGASKSEPHITLVIPRMLRAGKGEVELVSRLESALSIVPEFPVRMTGCDYFGNKRVIHIRVERSPEFARCHEAAMLAVADLLEATILLPVRGASSLYLSKII